MNGARDKAHGARFSLSRVPCAVYPFDSRNNTEDREQHLRALTLEGSSEFSLTQHTRTRLEAFLDMLRQHKKQK